MTLLLTEDDIKSVLDMSKVVEAVEEAFKAYGEGRINMPAKTYLYLEDGDFRAMYGVIKGIRQGVDICGIKWVNVHPGNPKKGLPTVMAKILLNDPETALELADMDGTYVTDLRTGAAGAVAAKYLSRKDSRVAAFIGAGCQSKTQLWGLLNVRKLREARIYDIDQSKAKNFSEEMTKKFSLEVYSVDSVKEAVEDCDILTTVTPSRKPVVDLQSITDGMHINAIGADAKGKEELDPRILKKSRIVIDDWSQASHSGEINVPLEKGIISRKDIYGNLGEIVTGKKEGRVCDEEVTIFDSTGLIIQDLAVGYLAYTLCKEKKLGEEKSFLSRLNYLD
ncbi:MAG: ornithine cyclodeaminase family protein [Candidatus Altiarchaeota archaeon]|nr:ornithine cyclodeaminase family protein [Candidatus Altiarchaeota archaeon]